MIADVEVTSAYVSLRSVALRSAVGCSMPVCKCSPISSAAASCSEPLFRMQMPLRRLLCADFDRHLSCFQAGLVQFCKSVREVRNLVRDASIVETGEWHCPVINSVPVRPSVAAISNSQLFKRFRRSRSTLRSKICARAALQETTRARSASAKHTPQQATVPLRRDKCTHCR